MARLSLVFRSVITMSGVEIGIAVVSAVAALIAAYKDGNKIADRIKKKRAKKGGLPPTSELEKALKDGEDGIKRARDEGKDVKVDTEAAMALKDLVIEVQGTLLHQLAEAEQDDSVTDFEDTIRTAVKTRRKAINVLNDLYLRTEEKEEKAKQETEKEVAHSVPERRLTVTTIDEEDVEKGKNRIKFWRRGSKDTRQNAVPTPETAPQSPSITRSSTVVPQSPTITRASTVYSDATRYSNWSAMSPPLSPDAIQPLSKDNDFGGFCKGAWYAQSLNLAKAVGKPSLKSIGWAFHCSKCSYTIQADVRDRNNPKFDDRVYKMEEMRFRLLFLLKSHLPQKNKRDKRMYGCLLCALAGESKKCTGEEQLIEHLQKHAMQTFGGTLLAGPVSVGTDGVMQESMSTYDVVFDGGEDFILPPSALEPTQSHESEPIDFAEVYGNVWADERKGGPERG